MPSHYNDQIQLMPPTRNITPRQAFDILSSEGGPTRTHGGTSMIRPMSDGGFAVQFTNGATFGPFPSEQEASSYIDFLQSTAVAMQPESEGADPAALFASTVEPSPVQASTAPAQDALKKLKEIQKKLDGRGEPSRGPASKRLLDMFNPQPAGEIPFQDEFLQQEAEQSIGPFAMQPNAQAAEQSENIAEAPFRVVPDAAPAQPQPQNREADLRDAAGKIAQGNSAEADVLLATILANSQSIMDQDLFREDLTPFAMLANISEQMQARRMGVPARGLPLKQFAGERRGPANLAAQEAKTAALMAQALTAGQKGSQAQEKIALRRGELDLKRQRLAWTKEHGKARLAFQKNVATLNQFNKEESRRLQGAQASLEAAILATGFMNSEAKWKELRNQAMDAMSDIQSVYSLNSKQLGILSNRDAAQQALDAINSIQTKAALDNGVQVPDWKKEKFFSPQKKR